EKLQIKAGYGIFFGSLLFGNGIVAQKLTSGNYNILALPFPFSSLPFTLPGGRIPESTQLPAGLPFVPQLSLIDRLDPNIRNSYSHQASFGIDYFLNRNTEFAVNYTLVRGLKIASRRNVNPVVRPIAGDPLTSRLIGRLDPTSGDIGQAASAFDSYYHGVTFSATRRLAKGFDLLASYTYSKAIDNVLQVLPTDTRVIDNPVNALRPGDERGLSIQDLRHRFVVSGNVALPLGKNIFLRDYAISFIVTATSGRPYNLIAGTDLNMNADDGDRPAGIGRNTGVTPGFTNFDVRLQRLLNFSDQYKMIFFAEAFNLFNKTNINPNTIDRVFPPDAQGRFNLPPQENGRFIVTPDRFRGAFSPRQIQLGFRVLF
ncbi:MAG: hypothetical protein JNN15_11680, partial [Blastocatellia bacterium]|nr:hypothetical protein [Blastocatellia bacterium]